MTCPGCGAAMYAVRDGFQCAYCQRVAFVEANDEGVRVLSASTQQTCPLCTSALMDASLAGVRLGYCTTCRGMAIAMSLFAGLVESVRTRQAVRLPAASAEDGEMRRTLPCPQCRHTMTADWYAGPGHVMIDSCERCCLLWLDHGELMRIACAPNSMRETASAER